MHARVEEPALALLGSPERLLKFLERLGLQQARISDDEWPANAELGESRR